MTWASAHSQALTDVQPRGVHRAMQGVPEWAAWIHALPRPRRSRGNVVKPPTLTAFPRERLGPTVLERPARAWRVVVSRRLSDGLSRRRVIPAVG
jgi:hypothetical protein